MSHKVRDQAEKYSITFLDQSDRSQLIPVLSRQPPCKQYFRARRSGSIAPV
jgi:hypothetical protein